MIESRKRRRDEGGRQLSDPPAAATVNPIATRRLGIVRRVALRLLNAGPEINRKLPPQMTSGREVIFL